ncbi:hypothetical protein [Arcobacter aquimarinus]|uniref:hypothetical protein n=1 Tax=Arcobacter aquimarinus TaxID=1315211 RepID=UPI003BB139D3
MAKKSYRVSQRVKFNGNISTINFTYECDETEIAGLVEKLAGNVKVYEENVALSSPDGATDVITGGLPVDSIAFVHSEAKTVYVGGYNKPIVFKESVSVQELRSMLKLHKPFSGSFETQLPDEVYPKVGTFGDL